MAPKEPQKDEPTYACKICGRRFIRASLEKHEPVCLKLSNLQRKPFDSGKQRASGSDLSYADIKKAAKEKMKVGGTFPRPKTNWRERHDSFIEAVASSKKVDYALKTGAPLPPPPRTAVPSDYPIPDYEHSIPKGNNHSNKHNEGEKSKQYDEMHQSNQIPQPPSKHKQPTEVPRNDLENQQPHHDSSPPDSMQESPEKHNHENKPDYNLNTVYQVDSGVIFDYVQCEYCGRNFNEQAATRHIPFCRESHMRKGSGVRPTIPKPMTAHRPLPTRSDSRTRDKSRERDTTTRSGSISRDHSRDRHGESERSTKSRSTSRDTRRKSAVDTTPVSRKSSPSRQGTQSATNRAPTTPATPKPRSNSATRTTTSATTRAKTPHHTSSSSYDYERVSTGWSQNKSPKTPKTPKSRSGSGERSHTSRSRRQ